MIAFASSLDQAGPMAQGAEDAALMLHVMAGFDRATRPASTVPVPDYLAPARTSRCRLRIGLPEEFFGEGPGAAEVRAAVREALRESYRTARREVPRSLAAPQPRCRCRPIM
jgi:aspartyl-tRNA(Asn)/glutamyl-tRNA(Gln) amidotransferase subunit A